jgi:hypothetical protein
MRVGNASAGRHVDGTIPPHAFAVEVGASIAIVVRTGGTPGALQAPIEAAIHAIDRDLPIDAVRTMDRRIETSTQQAGFTAP